MADPVCEICGGSGTIFVDDLNVAECRCARKRALRAYLGPEICAARTPEHGSPLFVHVPDDDPIDMTKKNIVIRGYWLDVLPHLKWALGAKAEQSTTVFPKYTILTDERLRTVWVGAESYSSRARSKRDEVQTYNSLNDIIGKDFDLVIIRLGHLGYKNIAMPGILKEALMLREVALKATWLIDSPQAPYTQGHFAYSEDVADYIRTRFEVIELSDYDSSRDEAVAPQGYTSEASAIEETALGGQAVPEGLANKMPNPNIRPPPSSSLETTYAASFPGDNKPKKKSKWSAKGRRGDE